MSFRRYTVKHLVSLVPPTRAYALKSLFYGASEALISQPQPMLSPQYRSIQVTILLHLHWSGGYVRIWRGGGSYW